MADRTLGDHFKPRFFPAKYGNLSVPEYSTLRTVTATTIASFKYLDVAANATVYGAGFSVEGNFTFGDTGTDSLTVNGQLNVNGPLVPNTVTVSNQKTTIKNTSTVFLSTYPGSRYWTLDTTLDSKAGKIILIKDMTSFQTFGTIQVYPGSGAKINGLTTHYIVPAGSGFGGSYRNIRLISNGTDWFVW